MTIEFRFISATDPLIAQAYAVRLAVFVLEQAVPLDMEIDEHEPAADHLVALNDGKGIGTLRLLYHDGGTVAKIGRVAVVVPYRGQHLGQELMLRAIDHIHEHGGCTAITLDAQTHAVSFYERLGFSVHGEPFLDAGIPHITMTMPLVSAAR